jgi:hypothetical protein
VRTVLFLVFTLSLTASVEAVGKSVRKESPAFPTCSDFRAAEKRALAEYIKERNRWLAKERKDLPELVSPKWRFVEEVCAAEKAERRLSQSSNRMKALPSFHGSQ